MNPRQQTFNIQHSTLIIMIASCLIVTLLAGCRPGGARKTGYNRIAGTWQSTEGQGNEWRFIFQKDGTMSEVSRPDGLLMVISEGGLTTDLPDEQLLAYFMYGPCVWSYDPASKILKATVTIEDFYVRAGDEELSCTLIDEFEGPLSEDGTTWNASWTTTNKWHDNAPDQVITGRTLILHKM